MRRCRRMGRTPPGVGEEGEDAHLPLAGRAPERVYLLDSRKQLRPTTSGAVVRRMLARAAGGPLMRVARSVVQVPRP